MAGEHALLGELRGITVPLDRWRPQIPMDAWPALLPENGVLWRADVFAVADAWRAGEVGARALLVAALMWGHGAVGYGPAHTRAVLEDDQDGTKLEHNLEPMRQDHLSDGDLRTAYQLFHTASPTRLRRPGPAFFTKLLYFVGYRRGSDSVQPLILDKRVAARLPAEAGPAGGRVWGWPSDQWMAYLDWAAGQARRPEFGGEADAVEMALFDGTWTAE